MTPGGEPDRLEPGGHARGAWYGPCNHEKREGRGYAMTTDSAQLICLYGVVRAGDRPDRGALAQLQTIVHGRLAALVEPVPAEDFRPEALAANLSSLEWVNRVARRHEELLGAVMETCPVIPARLCTLFSGREAVCRLLALNEETLTGLLDRLVDREERAVKIRCDEPALRRRIADTDREAIRLAKAAAAAAPGQAFGLLRRREAQIDNLVMQRLEAAQDRLLDILEALDVEVRIKSGAGEPAGRGERTLLHLAALVDRGGHAHLDMALDELAAELAPEGFTIERSGPWPPYSFADGGGGAELEVA